MRILFVSDLHSSADVWQKAIENAISNKVDLLILAGDHTGKYLVPIYPKDLGWASFYREKEYIFESKSEVRQFRTNLEGIGIYTKDMNFDEIEMMKKDKSYFNQIFDEVIIEHFEKLFRDLEKITNQAKNKILISLGNDDPFYLNEIFDKLENDQIFIGHENIVEIGENHFVNFEYSPPTPWSTPRELSEKKIEKKLNALIEDVTNKEKMIFNLHCPPYKTTLDMVPKLDNNLKPVTKGGDVLYNHIGSTSIRKIIEKCQPICSFHGHVHERPGKIEIGKTYCFNPGSEYDQGIFKGYIICIENNKIVDNWPITV